MTCPALNIGNLGASALLRTLTQLVWSTSRRRASSTNGATVPPAGLEIVDGFSNMQNNAAYAESLSASTSGSFLTSLPSGEITSMTSIMQGVGMYSSPAGNVWTTSLTIA